MLYRNKIENILILSLNCVRTCVFKLAQVLVPSDPLVPCENTRFQKTFLPPLLGKTIQMQSLLCWVRQRVSCSSAVRLSVCLSARVKKNSTPTGTIFFCVSLYWWLLLKFVYISPIWLESGFKVTDTLREDRRAFVKVTLHLRFNYWTRNPLPNTKEWCVLRKTWKITF